MATYLNDNRFNYNTEEFLLLDSSLQNNPEFVLNCLKKNGLLLEVINTNFKNDPNFIAAAIENDYQAFNYIPENVLNDEENIIAFIHVNALIYQLFDDSKRSNRRLVLAAMNYFGVDAFWDLGWKFYNDVEIMYKIVTDPQFDSYGWEGISCAYGEEPEKARQIILRAIEIFGDKILQHDMNWIKRKIKL